MKWSLNIADGRRFFWQWDTGCLLNVGGISEGSELHFTNSAFPEPLTVKTFKKESDVLCKVPDEILQTSGRFYVFVYMCEEDNGYTVYEKSFVVNPKPKPADYVYTETERYTVDVKISEALRAYVPLLSRPVDDDENQIDGYFFYGMPSSDNKAYGTDINKLMLIRGSCGRGTDNVVIRDKYGRFMVQDPDIDIEGKDKNTGYVNIPHLIRYYAANRGWVLDTIEAYLGDVESALDNIIKIQESLIGGNT